VKISRRLSGRISWALDNLLPPVLRDAPWFMRPLMRLLFGAQTDCFMGFKARAPALDRDELIACYRATAAVHLQRESDLTPEVVARILADVVGEDLLDIACGSGYLARELARRTGKNVTGIDFNWPADGRDERVTNLRGTIDRIDFADRSFDTVISTHTLEHVVDIEAAIAELRRVTRRRLIVVVPRQRNYRYTFDLHLHFFQYPHDLLLVMRNPRGEVCRLGNDFYYREDVA
jgi:SAM-dependent methyltransferase